MPVPLGALVPRDISEMLHTVEEVAEDDLTVKAKFADYFFGQE
jgi:hypothetical protein